MSSDGRGDGQGDGHDDGDGLGREDVLWKGLKRERMLGQ